MSPRSTERSLLSGATVMFILWAILAAIVFTRPNGTVVGEWLEFLWGAGLTGLVSWRWAQRHRVAIHRWLHEPR